MMEISIENLIPRFLLEDRNGYALAKAMEKALEIVCEKTQTGVNTILDVEAMPEWRLDEMAWELGCLYDYTGTLDQKRKWIRESTPLYAAYGTVQAIYNYLQGMFDEIAVEEFWEYDGNPFHFRVIVDGGWTVAKAKWVLKAINATMNVRSVLDSVSVGCRSAVSISGTSGMIVRVPYLLCGETLCGKDVI